jgi:hypothetical protein
MSPSSLHLPFLFSTPTKVDLINKIKFNALQTLKLLIQEKNLRPWDEIVLMRDKDWNEEKEREIKENEFQEIEENLIELGMKIMRDIVKQLKIFFGEEKFGKNIDALMEVDSVREILNEASEFLCELAGDYRFFSCFVDDEIRLTYFIYFYAIFESV